MVENVVFGHTDDTGKMAVEMCNLKKRGGGGMNLSGETTDKRSENVMVNRHT